MKRANADSSTPDQTPDKIPKLELTDSAFRPPEMDHRRWVMKNVKDCKISVGQGESKMFFEASKVTLALKSPVLCDLLLKASNENVYNLPDVSTKAFELLMPFFYHLEEDIFVHLTSPSIALELLQAVCRLQINELKDPILNYVVINLEADFMFLALDLARQFDISRLENACFDLFSTEITAWLNNERFLSISPTNLLKLFKMERFCPEIEMFKALERYASHNGLQRTSGDANSAILENILREIHFLMVPPNVLFDALADSKLLLEREKMLIVAHATNPDTDLPLPDIISTVERDFSLFVGMIFIDMRDLFPQLGEKLFWCGCGMRHNLRFEFWEHDFKTPEKLKQLEAVLKTAGLPNNLEVVANTDISAVQRAVGRFMVESDIFEDIFNISFMEQYLV